MKKIILFATLGTFAFITLAFQTRPATWTVNTDDATVEWELPYEPNPEGGTIGGLTAEISFDSEDLSNSHIKASVQTSTFTSDSKLKTKHLKGGKNYLDGKNFPEISFESTQITATGPSFEAQGTVSFRGQEFPVVIPFEFQKKKKKGTFIGSWEMNTEEMNIDQNMKSLKEGKVENNLRITFSLPVES